MTAGIPPEERGDFDELKIGWMQADDGCDVVDKLSMTEVDRRFED